MVDPLPISLVRFETLSDRGDGQMLQFLCYTLTYRFPSYSVVNRNVRFQSLIDVDFSR